MILHRLAVCFAAAAWACAGMSLEEIALPEGGRSMLPEDLSKAIRVRPQDDPTLATSEVITVEGLPFDRAIRVTVVRRPEQAWDIGINVDTKGAIEKGDVCLLSFYIRGPHSEDESGDAVAGVYLQRNRAPWQKVLQARVTANREWRQVVTSARVGMALPDGGSNVVFHLGYYPQTVEVGGLRLLNYGTEVSLKEMPGAQTRYNGREADAAWRKAAAERIERMRKGELTIQVVGGDGTPVRGAEVEVKMRRHAFGFGSAVTAQMLSIDTEDAQRYRETVGENYNKVVFENDLKWQPWDVSKSNTHSSFRQQWLDAALAWLKERDIEVRGHYVTWAPLDKANAKYVGHPEELRRDLWAHMEEKLPAVGTRVGEWDAVNHIVGWGQTFASVCGGPQIYADIIKHSRELAPHAELWVNEGQVLPGGGRRRAYEHVIRFLMEHDAAPDGIGFMGHFGGSSLTPPEELYEVFERFAELIPNLQLTELDVQVGTDEELQADYLRDVMTVAFSHPAMQAIVMWGFWEGRHWKPDAALYRRDWSPKPAGEVWKELVFSQWWTDEKGNTDNAGRFRTRGFLGDYEIVVTAADKTRSQRVTLERGGAAVTVKLD
jgi:GH35 family endo-1,4-beta-xylanase